ncbi:MAG TPA: aldehyde ferredoxin oxidoreductase family protein, partial [Thermomicrobiales bacterium]|nr:aldehyde ferredoxin oxidoreductase family protein [Thermomicrobiales bacterium]
MLGVHGRLLRIDLATGGAEAEDIPAEAARLVLGGIGLASLLLLRECPPGADPLGPDNPLIFAASPFIGTGITTASKIALAARSPQTGMIGDSLSSSYLALALKRTGFDAIVIHGQAPDWSVLTIDGARVTLRPAGDLLGLEAAAAADNVRAAVGRGFRVATIGPAGERLVRYAAVANDGRLAGRTGAGAVMGSKRLKAIAIRGERLPRVADPAGVAHIARSLADRSLGPATAKYRELGTAANLAFFNRMGVLPTRNFRSGAFDGAERIAGETLLLDHHADRHACAACTVGCEHHYRTRDGGPAVETRLEYETLFALGSLCGVDDPNVVLRAAARCDALGIDAISTGATIAWAMDCAERGVDLGAPTADLPRFGDGAALLRTIDGIGARRGIGDLLAEGSRRAAEIVGHGSDAWAMHVKGLELPGYDPRKLETMALGLAVAARGACHNRSSAYEVDFSDRLDPEAEIAARARAAADAEDRAAVLDSLTLCKFLRHAFDDLYAENADLLTRITGEPFAADDLARIGERIATVKKRF